MQPNVYRSVPWIVCGIILAFYSCSERRAGRLDEQIAQLAAQHRADSLRADSVGREARRMAQEAAKARSEAQTAVRQSEAARIESQRNAEASSEARRLAGIALRDSLTGRDSLQGLVRTLLTVGRADSAAFAHQRTTDSTTIAKLLVALAKDSLAIARQTQSYAALEQRAEAAERLASAYRSQRGGGWRGMAVAAGITYGACRWVVRCQ